MDIKWKKYSHSVIAKILVFLIAILCFTGSITIFFDINRLHNGDFSAAFEGSYYHGKGYLMDCENIVTSLRQITEKYKSEEHILNGGSVTEEELKREENQLFNEFQYNSKNYNPNLTAEENYQIFRGIYADKIARVKAELIQEDLKEYQATLRRVEKYQGVLYYAHEGETEFTNSPNKAKDYFKAFPAYLLFDGAEQKVFPEEIKENRYYYWISSDINQLTYQDNIYIAFTKEFINPRITEWQENKVYVTNSLYQLTGLLLGLIAALIYLIIVIGRKPGEDREIHLNFLDRLYTDFNLVICFSFIALWFGYMCMVYQFNTFQFIFPVTFIIGTCGLIFVLSLVKHLKNGTLIKHSLTYTAFHKLFNFAKEIFDSGSLGVKVALIVIGYPIAVALTFFMFPITIGIAAWLTLKKVKEYKAIKEGVKKVKDGDIYYKINVAGNGEFASFAADINSITDGLKKAVEKGIKSERLKTELITNVSHDIRTPLTSIITYVDLLKTEQDQLKVKEYLEIIDQKSQRLKILTDDLFEAAKATSGNLPVNFEKIDLVALITQGLGEVDEQIREHKLEFKFNYPQESQEKVFIKADGKLLSRAVENLLSNIFKYALMGSRVYIDIIDVGTGVTLIIKNISADELNISAEELMERFTRGDKARSSEGSGLGLSITKSLIEIQKGSFNVEIDGDLFKAIIYFPQGERY